MHLRFFVVALDPCCSEGKYFWFQQKYKHNYMKKHDVWIVPWTSSQLFVPRLNEKSIPGPRIKQKPPFLSSLPPIAIVFMYRLIKRQRKKLKQRKLISGRFFLSKCQTIKRLAMSTPCWTGLQNGKRAKSHRTPTLLTSVFTNEPSSPSPHSRSSP